MGSIFSCSTYKALSPGQLSYVDISKGIEQDLLEDEHLTTFLPMQGCKWLFLTWLYRNIIHLRMFSLAKKKKND